MNTAQSAGVGWLNGVGGGQREEGNSLLCVAFKRASSCKQRICAVRLCIWALYCIAICASFSILCIIPLYHRVLSDIAFTASRSKLVVRATCQLAPLARVVSSAPFDSVWAS